MKLRLGRSTAILAMVCAFIMVSVLPGGLAAAAAPNLTPGPSYTLWAYGAVRTVSFSGPAGNLYDYQGSATYGYSVILNQTNLTSQTFELSANQTMGALLSVDYCTPNCKHPTATATVTHNAWESVDDWANFTTDANVTESGVAVPAIGLINTHTTVRGSLFDSAQGLVRDEVLSTNVSANASVSFATPLGLLPDNLSAPSSWNSTSNFSASGSYAISFHYQFTGPKATFSIGPSTTSGSVAGTGTVSVAGAVASGPASSVSFGGVPYLNVSLAVEGPFAAREGFILVPEDVDLFGTSASAPWSANETGGASAQMTSIYVRPDDPAHLGIGGSEWLYSASALNPSVTDLTPTSSGVNEIASGANDVSSTPVQGVPIPVDQAQGYQGCLLTGASCSSAPGKLPFPLLFVGLIAGAVLIAVAVVTVSERRRIPPPLYPNAELYPVGGPAAATARDSAPASPPRKPATPEDDPLSNLW